MDILASQSESVGDAVLAKIRDRVAQAIAPSIFDFVRTAGTDQRRLMLNWLISTSSTLTLIHPGHPPESGSRYLTVQVGGAPYYLDAVP
eukprot:6098390-Amphidinium_carterae.1